MTLVYRADGRRVSKETPAESKHFIYDLNRVLQETDDDGDPLHEYTSTLGAWGDLVSEYDGVDTLYHQYDALGTTDSLMDDTESAAARYAHSAFGVEESFTGTSDSSFTFVGAQNYYRDPELELYLAGVRYYDPAAGRWLSEDPIGINAGDANFYRYVRNNPVKAIDPSGLDQVGVRNGNVVEWIATNETHLPYTFNFANPLSLGETRVIGTLQAGGWVKIADEYGGGYAALDSLRYWASQTTSTTVHGHLNLDHTLDVQIGAARLSAEQVAVVMACRTLLSRLKETPLKLDEVLDAVDNGSVRKLRDTSEMRTGLFGWMPVKGSRLTFAVDVTVGESVFTVLYQGPVVRNRELVVLPFEALPKGPRTDAVLEQRRGAYLTAQYAHADAAMMSVVPVAGTRYRQVSIARFSRDPRTSRGVR